MSASWRAVLTDVNRAGSHTPTKCAYGLGTVSNSLCRLDVPSRAGRARRFVRNGVAREARAQSFITNKSCELSQSSGSKSVRVLHNIDCKLETRDEIPRSDTARRGRIDLNFSVFNSAMAALSPLCVCSGAPAAIRLLPRLARNPPPLDWSETRCKSEARVLLCRVVLSWMRG